uniref:Tyrosine-protein phosphatase domain-containing protein n=1 Tax=Ascaris lumbricoides TaxID=6252 RepID=A0A0M3IKY1_ASCLU
MVYRLIKETEVIFRVRIVDSGSNAYRMLLVITILILFVYTVVLIAFFMGWCTLVPTMCHPRREIPFCAVKSPRRNTKYIDLESISSSVSLDYLHRVFESSNELERKYSVLSVKQPPLNDYLHPKYSLPPIEIDVEEEKVLYSNCFFFFCNSYSRSLYIIVTYFGMLHEKCRLRDITRKISVSAMPRLIFLSYQQLVYFQTYFEFLRTPAEIASKRMSIVKLSTSKTPKEVDDSIEKII